MPTREEIDRLEDFVSDLGGELRMPAESDEAGGLLSASIESDSSGEQPGLGEEGELSAGFADSELAPGDREGVDAGELSLPPDAESVSDGDYSSAAESEPLGEQFGEPGGIEPAADEVGDRGGDSDFAAGEDSDFGEELILDEEMSSIDQPPSETAGTEAAGGNKDEPEYSLGDFGDNYDFPGEKNGRGEAADTISAKPRPEGADVRDEEGPFPLREEHYTAVQQTLAGLPRNLKLAIEEALADERIAPKALEPLIDALIQGVGPQLLVKRLWKITKRKIALPRGYEKLSGRLLLRKKTSLSYRLGKKGWSIIRMVFLIIAITWMFGAAVFMWIYRPLMAEHIYDMGLEAINSDNVNSAITHFYDAWYGWPLFAHDGTDRIVDSQIVVKGWKNKQKWLDYIAAFRARKYWGAAESFYAEYLKFKPDDEKVRLQYAEYLSGVMGRHEEAITVLEEAPKTGGKRWDREYTLAAGDIYLDWAQDDPTKYEEARFRYAKALETSRNDERAYLSMMNYHLRLSNEEEIALLLPVFEKEVPGKTDAPKLAATVYADLAEYFLARGNNRDSKRFIELARTADPLAPEPSFISAMYWRLVGDEEGEYQAYKTTLANLNARESSSQNDLRMRILTLGGVGRIQSANGKFQAAMGSYDRALSLFEDARARNQLGASPEYGQLYLEGGKIIYRGFGSSSDLIFSLNPETLVEGSDRYAELAQAERYFNMAEEIFGSGAGGGLPPEVLYKRSYIRYVLGLGGALADFYEVARYEPANYEARLALATALLVNGDFETSRNQYLRTLELLNAESREFEGISNPAEQQKYAELLIRYVFAWNNLGVSRARSASRGGGDADYADALSAFTMASTYLDEVESGMHALNARGLTGVRGSEQERIASVEDGYRLLLDKTTYPHVNRLRLLGIGEFEADDYLFYPDIPSSL